MRLAKQKLGDFLISLGMITKPQLDEALEAQRLIPMPLGAILVNMGFVSEDLMLGVMAQDYGVNPWSLDELPPTADALSRLDGEVCRKYLVVPVAVEGEVLTLAMANPDDVEAVEVARYATRMKVEPVLATRFRILQAVEKYYGTTRDTRSVDELVDTAIREIEPETPSLNTNTLLAEAESAPVVSIVNQTIQDGVRAGASDIHLEPRRGRMEIRFRVDGQLRKVRDVPRSLQPMIIARLKIMSDMDVVETRLPQDGRIAVSVDGRAIDLRLSMAPSQHGQRIVMRILDRFVGMRRLEDIGFTPDNLEKFREIARMPHGIFLVTGPTGSGKTTTLYALLSELKDVTNNVMTCEDPIEYELDGINQTQINERIGLTFSKQLRAILRQDPDIILVGEIRDADTAETAIRAALTGHLVLSTLHANDSIGTIPRLLDMGVESFLLGNSLVGILSQRLLRLLCSKCKKPHRLTDSEKFIWEAYGRTPPDQVYHKVGCHFCGGMGFKGRSAVHELLAIEGPIGAMIAARESQELIRVEAMKRGFRPIQHHALDLIDEGLTSIEEASRVVHLQQQAKTVVRSMMP